MNVDDEKGQITELYVKDAVFYNGMRASRFESTKDGKTRLEWHPTGVRIQLADADRSVVVPHTNILQITTVHEHDSKTTQDRGRAAGTHTKTSRI